VRGFIQVPFFNQITYNYLLVLANNPLLGAYLTLD
jgi:hypothetical protein